MWDTVTYTPKKDVFDKTSSKHLFASIAANSVVPLDTLQISHNSETIRIPGSVYDAHPNLERSPTKWSDDHRFLVLGQPTDEVWSRLLKQRNLKHLDMTIVLNEKDLRLR